MVAAACSHEFIKAMSYLGPSVDNYMMYMGKNSVNVAPVHFTAKSDCIVCQNNPIDMDIPFDITVEDLVTK